MTSAQQWSDKWGGGDLEAAKNILTIQLDALHFAAEEVNKLAAHLVGNTKVDGTRDPVVYEQGIGCELAGKMLREMATLMK
jgi:hypothetical protein